MIAVLKNGVTKAQRDNLIHWLESQNVRVHVSEGEMQTVLGLIGDTRKIDIDLLAGLEIIDASHALPNLSKVQTAVSTPMIPWLLSAVARTW